MSHVITFESDTADDGAGNEPGLFDDDDPFNLPPPLPPLSPQRDDDQINQDGDGDQTAGNADKKEANKKRRAKRSPRPKLDEVRLCSDRGIPALRHICDDIKFKGKGHEASDLNLLMQRYEHWAHRLFPKFPFVDVVDQVENLGSKKLVQNCIKRIRCGEEETVDDENKSDTEIGQNINGSQGNGTPSQAEDTPVANNIQTFGEQVEARDKMVILTPEVQERIRLNRERALAKRKAAHDQERQAEQDNTETGQTDAQTGETEQAAGQSTDNAGIARDDDHIAENLVMENNHSAQTNDIEMEDETNDKNAVLPEDDELESGTNVDTATSTPIESTNENAVDIDTEMGNNALDAGAGVSQNGENVYGVDNGSIGGTTLDNDLPATKDLPRHKDDSDLVTAQPMPEETSLSFPSDVDQSASGVLNDQALQQEVCKETLDAPPMEQAPDQNEPEGPQSTDMETEQ